MTKTLTIVFLSALLFSCKKQEPKRNILRSFISFEKPLISKADSILVRVKYFKDYPGTDEVSLTVNGIKGKVNRHRSSEMEGTNYSFKFPPISNPGNAEVVLSIENGKETYTDKRILRIIENYNLDKVWDKLDKQYVVNLLGLATGDVGSTISLGTYMETSLPALKEFNFYPFINGFNGAYSLSYDDNNILKAITISNGSVHELPGLTYRDVLQDVSRFYGPVVSVEKDRTYYDGDITKFETSRFNILVYEHKAIGHKGGIITLISLK